MTVVSSEDVKPAKHCWHIIVQFLADHALISLDSDIFRLQLFVQW